MERGIVTVAHVPTASMVADVLTKPLAKIKFFKFIGAIVGSPQDDSNGPTAHRADRVDVSKAHSHTDRTAIGVTARTQQQPDLESHPSLREYEVAVKPTIRLNDRPTSQLVDWRRLGSRISGDKLVPKRGRQRKDQREDQRVGQQHEQLAETGANECLEMDYKQVRTPTLSSLGGNSDEGARSGHGHTRATHQTFTLQVTGGLQNELA